MYRSEIIATKLTPAWLENAYSCCTVDFWRILQLSGGQTSRWHPTGGMSCM